ncbi:MAG: AbiV family abortive infection protein [Acidobacteriota bacterium]
MRGVSAQKRATLHGMNLALENGRGLLKDARILLSHRRTNGAFLLSVSALEEAGRVLYLALVPDVARCDRWFVPHPLRVTVILAPDWQIVFSLRHHKLPASGDTGTTAWRRAARELSRHVGRGSRPGPEFSVRGLVELRRQCTSSSLEAGGREALWPNGLPRTAASATVRITAGCIERLARLRHAYRRGEPSLLSEQLAQALHSRAELGTLLREMRIPRPRRPRLLPATISV